MEATAIFGFPGEAGQWPLPGPLFLSEPERVLRAHQPEEVAPLLAEVQRACDKGMWAAVMVAYEAAPGLDPDLSAHGAGEFPLAWAALCQAPLEGPPAPPGGRTRLTSWRPGVSEGEYLEAVASIREDIRRGETYQVNYTAPHFARIEGDPLDLYLKVARFCGQGYCAYLDMGRFQVLSFSPELFFHRQGDEVRAEPMKGTMGRGRWLEEDRAMADRLAACPKNRAENVMIVDLVRNDLGKVAETGSVRAGPLFQVTPYPTLLQMTSTVTARLLPGTGLAELMAALFPCGSVTGAPKARTMEIIRRMEPHPRLAYCGAVGYVAPGGDCAFNVPIRTVVAERSRSRAVFSVGGGITHDSTGPGEREECGRKMRFLTSGTPRFRLLESLLLTRGGYLLLAEHLARLADSARYFFFSLDLDRVRRALDRAARNRRASHGENELAKVRLLLSRDGRVEVESAGLDPLAQSPLKAALAEEPVDSRDPMLQHKTTRRGVYKRARAFRPGADEVILWNERGRVTELCTANIVARLDGALVTPPREEGLLPGAMRAMLLARGVLGERPLEKDDLARAQGLWLVNSVRGWRRLELADPGQKADRPG